MKFPLGSRIPDSEHKSARTDSEAEERFTHSMNAALGQLTRVSSWRVARPKYGDARTLVMLPEPEVPLICRPELPLYFAGSVEYAFERDQRPGHEGGRKVVVTGYIYSLRIGREEDGEFAAWHWHPRDKPKPHLHVRADHPDVPGLSGTHLPTARVFLEDVLIYAISDLGAQCRDQDTAALEVIRTRTERWASWR